MKKKMVMGRQLCEYTGYDYGSCASPFLSLPSIYTPSVILIPFVLSKIWRKLATIMKNG